MFKALLKRSKSPSVIDEEKPDISRVLPGFREGAARVVPKATLATELTEEEATAGTDGTDAEPLLLDDSQRIAEPEIEPQFEVEADTAEEVELVAEGPVQAPEASEWLGEDLLKLRAAAADFLADGAGETERRHLFLVAHNMRGAAGGYGYPVIERITGSLCLLLEHDHDFAGADALINLHVEACRAAANHRGAQASLDLADAVCTALEDQVSARLTGWG
ncbi:MAG: hypothetical protein AAF253_06220 [Pseudomonadota bacterium]